MPRYFIKDNEKTLTKKERQIRYKFVMCSFLRYLKTRDVYGEFYLNFTKSYRYNEEYTIDSYFDDIQRWPSDVISSAFTWVDTQQGDRFWMNLHDEWRIVWREQLKDITYSS